MKTTDTTQHRCHRPRAVRWLVGLAIVVSQLALTTARAQDAFYIYQNDGHFHGFFYDEVLKMGYSHTDTLGRTFDFPVSQEIVTADSTYRFMLTAIDSVSFVQPEIRFNPRLRNLADAGMLPYLVASDGLTLTFRSDMPADVQPKEGDVLVCFDFSRFEGGYGGRVTRTQTDGTGLVVSCDSLTSLADIFEQFVTTERYTKANDSTPAQSRMAGVGTIRRAAYDGWLRESYPFSGAFDFHVPLRWNTDTGDATMALNLHFGIGLKCTASYDIRPNLLRSYIGLKFEELIEHSATFTASGKIGEPLEGKPFDGAVAWIAGKLGFPMACPVVQVNVMPEAMLRAEASFNFTIGYGMQQSRLMQFLEYNNGDYKAHVNMTEPPKSDDYEKETGLTLQAEINGYAQAGIKLPIEVTSNRMIDNILKWTTGIYFYVGPKISGNVTLDLWAMRKPGWYNLMKESKIDFTLVAVDWEAKTSIKTWGARQKDWTFVDGSFGFGTKSIYLVPEFDGLSVSPKQGSKTVVTGTVLPKRDVLFDEHIGLGVYDVKERLVQKWYDESHYYNFLMDAKVVPLVHDFDIKESGKYRLRPLMRLKRVPGLDIPYVPDDEVEFTIDNSKLDISPGELLANKIGGQRFITIDSDLDHFQLSAEVDWLKFNTESYGAKQRGIIFDPLPDNEIERKATIAVVGYNQDESFRKITLLQVTQNLIGSNEPALSTSPARLEFEATSGKKDAQLLTNCADAKVQSAEKWMKATIGGGKVTVQVEPNPSLDERKGFVSLAGTKDGTAATSQLEVLQEGVLALSAHRLEYAPEGGDKDVTIRSGGFDVSVECQDDWYTATLDGGRLVVTCEENWTVAERTGEVVLSVNVSGTVVETSLEVVQDAFIICEPAGLTNVGPWGTVEDIIVKGSQLTNLSIDAITEWVGIGMTDDGRRLTISVDENTGNKREGAATISGYKGKTKYTLRIPVTQLAGGEEQEDLPFEVRVYSPEIAPEGGTTSGTCTGSTDGVAIKSNRSWLKASFRKLDGDYGYSVLEIQAPANPDEWHNREGTITLTKQMSKTEIYSQQIDVTQLALCNAEPRIWGDDHHYISYDMEKPDTLYVGSRYVDKLTIKHDSAWIDAWWHGDNNLLVDASINRNREERTGHITITGTNKYGKEAEHTISITQNEYYGYNRVMVFGGVCVGLRTGGTTFDDEIWNGAHSTYYPYARGVYGHGFSSGNFEETITIKPNYSCSVSVNYTDDYGTTTRASFTDDTGILNGSFSYESKSQRLSFHVHNMPARGMVPPSKYSSSWADRTYWGSGVGGSDVVNGSYGNEGYVTSFNQQRLVTDYDSNGNPTGQSWHETKADQLQVNVYIYCEGSTFNAANLPVGHPNAK